MSARQPTLEGVEPKPLRRMLQPRKHVLRERIAELESALAAEQDAANSLRATLVSTQCTVLDLREALQRPWWRRLFPHPATDGGGGE